jgi:hypothetical protein
LATPDPSFPQLVSLACHDLRTPLATVQGFAKTLLRMEQTPEQRKRYLGMIDDASAELVELLEELSLAARIEGGRYEPHRREVDSLELARAAADRVPGLEAQGEGAAVEVDPDAAERVLAAFGRATLRHGVIDAAELRVSGAVLSFGPVGDGVGPVLLGTEAKDLGAAVGVRVLGALGASVEVAGDELVLTLPVAT